MARPHLWRFLGGRVGSAGAWALAGWLLAAVCWSARAQEPSFDVPEGFEVSLFADDDLAHDIYSLTIDAHGRVVVSGPGYVKILHDDNGDGRADRAQLFSGLPAGGAHGMLFLGDHLLATGDDTVMLQRDTDGDGAADGEPEVWARLRNPEHGANGIVQGPDGWIYIVCGNDAGVSEKNITTSTSPVKQPRCGAIVRFSPDGRQQEVVAHGFRNPYDLDFNAEGRLFCVDSDNERDYHLPWYAPTRLFEVGQGMEHGWLQSGWQRSWNRPGYFFDSVPRAVEIGRGSPTGLVCYRHHQFPAKYQGGIFSACWTLGRIYFLPLEPFGTSYRSRCETFLSAHGSHGFAPCDLAVGPSGDLFVAMGGRRTRGGVFRVRYKNSTAIADTAGGLSDETVGAAELEKVRLEKVLSAEQPLSAWSRAVWQPAAKEIGRGPFEAAALGQGLPKSARDRAIEVLVEQFGGVSDELAGRLSAEVDDRRLARVAWAVGRGPVTPQAAGRLVGFALEDKNPSTQRGAWETLAAWPKTEPVPAIDWALAFRAQDTRTRAAVFRAAAGPLAESFAAGIKPFADSDPEAAAWARYLVAATSAEYGQWKPEEPFFELCLKRMLTLAAQDNAPAPREMLEALMLEALRMLELGLGDFILQPGQAEVFSGYRGNAAERLTIEQRGRLAAGLLSIFPAANDDVNLEIARLLGMLGAEAPGGPEKIGGLWTAQSSTENDIHYLIVAALLPGARTSETTNRAVMALLNLETKLRQKGEIPSQNWPARVGEMFVELCRRDGALAERLVDHADFGRPEHALYAERLKGDLRARATRCLLAANKAAGDPLTAELVRLTGGLPAAEGLPILRSAWDEPGLRDTVALALARHPQAEDRGRFIAALGSWQPQVCQAAAEALIKLGGRGEAVEQLAALQALRQACQAPDQAALRKQLVALLEQWSGGAVKADEQKQRDPAALWADWQRWFAQAHPAEAAQLGSTAGGNAVPGADWDARVASLDITAGDAAHGQLVFEKRLCQRCHQASGALGPDLTGAVSRMSVTDLFAAIVDPNREVSPAFQASRVTAPDGQVYHGMIVYESPEATLLRTGPDTTVRIVGVEKSHIQPSRQSLMPTGLLQGASDQELTDLYAYLRTLAKKK